MSSESPQEAEIELGLEAQHQALVREYCVAVSENPDHVWTQGKVTTMRKALVTLGKALRRNQAEYTRDEPSYKAHLIGLFQVEGMIESTATVHAGVVSRTVFPMEERVASVAATQQATSGGDAMRQIEP